MRLVKGLYSGFFVTALLLIIGSCSVSTPPVPTAVVQPATMSTIGSSDAIVITFNTSMAPSTLALSGNMATQSAAAVWSDTNAPNDTLTIKPSAKNGDVWLPGSYTLVVNVSSSKATLPTLTLEYVVGDLVPTAVVAPASSATIIGSDIIAILFSTSMDISTLALSGDMAAESDNGTWSTLNKKNDYLVIRPASVWSGIANTLVINANSAAGVPSPALTLNYTIDTTVPVITAALPADNTAINGSMPLVISFNSTMKPATLNLSGSLATESDGGVWSSNSNTDDTLVISPVSV